MILRKSLLLAVSQTLLFAILLGNASDAHAQLPRDVKDVFQGMLDDLDEDLQAKFKTAIKNDTATVEFTPAEFKRFRANPINPFEGLDAIKVEEGGGNIALKFELPSFRNRQRNRLERQSPVVLDQIKQPVSSVSVSTVAILEGDLQVALGLVVRDDGYILTKASEVETSEGLVCELNNGQRLEAKIVRTDTANDLAILKVEAANLSVVRWSEKKPKSGTFVLTPDQHGKVVAIGTYSVAARSTALGKQAFLGVQPETTSQGVRVGDIRSGSASFAAGLQNGDILTKLGGVRLTNSESLVKAIRDRVPGDTVEIEYLRNGSAGKTNATLADRDYSGEQAARFKMMNRLGAIPSRRDDNFPSVFQHDSPLFPEQCGGPITDLDGNVLGVNIARHGRAATYAIPASHVQTVLKDLLRENIASR
jgi:serine protease Do